MRTAKHFSLRKALTNLGVGAVAATALALASSAPNASPLMMGNAPTEGVQTSLVHQVVIYAKEGRKRLTDGRWNLSKAKSKLGLTFSSEEKRQLMACTGQISCRNNGNDGSASAVLSPNLLITAKHVFAGRRRSVQSDQCTFRSFLHPNTAIPIRVDKDQRKHFFLNNEDFIVVRLKRALKDCKAFAINGTDTSLSEGDPIVSATAYQHNMLNRVSRKEPVIAKGKIRSASTGGFFGGPPFYYADVDLKEGGSGGAVFALKNGRPVSDDQGRLTVRGILVRYGQRAQNNKPYSEERNFTIIIGLQGEFREVLEGKANGVSGVDRAYCLEDAEPKIDVISEPVPKTPPEPLTAYLKPESCSHETLPGEPGQPALSCAKLAEEMQKLQKKIKAIAASTRTPRRKGRTHQFKLKNDTTCPVCFTYDRCNDYGCWDQTVRASGGSILFAGVRKEAPTIKNPQFCLSGRLLSDWRPPLPPMKPLLPPPLPLRNPALAVAVSSVDATEANFLAAKAKAERNGVWALTPEDVRGLSLEQISTLRGY